MYPAEYLYSKEHEWIRVEGEVGTVGITDFAQAELGDVVFVELPAVGKKLVAGNPFGSVESVKAVSDLFSPVSGEVTEVNGSLADRPEQINQDPHGAAWIVKVRLSNPDDLKALMKADAYERHIAGKK
jgi:glycine cleavage system H protein